MSKCDLPKSNVSGVIIGIDPGATGAIAIVSLTGSALGTFDIPSTAEGSGSKQQCNAYLLADLFTSICKEHNVLLVVLEHVSAMPKQGVTSSFNFGMNYGIVKGVIGAFKLPLRLVRPSVWKKQASLGRDKELARQKAISQWPTMTDRLRRKLDADRAEALLIADFGRSLVK